MMTIHDIAGFCPEEAVWKLLADVSECLLNDGVGNGLSPGVVTIDGNTFMVNGTEEAENTFQAPEHKDGQPSDEKENVWSLGATAYYAATGHVVFGGHGGSYQKEHPLVTLPALPKGMQALTPLMQRCLCYDANERIGLKALNDLARKGFEECGKLGRTFRGKRREERGERRENSAFPIKEERGEKWPEEMRAAGFALNDK